MRIGSLFSGIGGLELGLEWAGVGHTVWQIENNPFARKILAKHWPHADRSIEDVRQATKHNLSPVDVLVGGFPCQDVSSAGKRAGLEGSRSGLWYEFLRIVGELQPPVVVVENVYSGKDLWLPFVREDLEGLGYRVRAFELSAEEVGLPHKRRRVFVVAYSSDYRRAFCGSGHDAGQSLEHDEAGHEPHRRDPHRRAPAGPLGWDEQAQADHPAYFLGGSPRLPDRLDRFVALGNSVSPWCSEVIGRIILDLDTLAGDDHV